VQLSGKNQLLVGVIEGFYGRSWSHSTRLAYARYLQCLGLNSYIYCPKSDPFLRKRWPERWPEQTRAELKELALAYAARNINCGIGLSPFALYENYGGAQQQALKNKIEYLAELEMPILAILFDDMPGALDALAERQAQIVADVCEWAPQSRILVCPTYYSFDPVLEKHFGAMPEHYWSDLGRYLPRSADIFWTGNRVCSESITTGDIEQITRKLGRKVLLWDNYPVNDGAQRSNYLYCSELAERDHKLAAGITGHFCNPMNQAHLSLMALLGLPTLYGQRPPDGEWLQTLYGRETYQQLLLDKHDFETLGLTGMGERRCDELARVYSRFSGQAAAEVVDWLRGEYTFDPDCLTD
jgi:hyaluronoglucosaminidase